MHRDVCPAAFPSRNVPLTRFNLEMRMDCFWSIYCLHYSIGEASSMHMFYAQWLHACARVPAYSVCFCIVT
jgi:hypothetical protein